MVRRLSKQFTSFVEINFEETPSLSSVFDTDLTPQRILRDLELTLGVTIIPEETLLFFDEVQLATNALLSLRYFYEKLPELHIIAAGSLLDFAIAKVGLPVGRVSFLHVNPMTFIEFLWALDRTSLAKQITEHTPQTPLSTTVHNTALKFLGEYFAIGGMPEAIATWRENGNYQECSLIHQDIINTYQQDFEKYARTAQVKYVEKIFNLCSLQVGKQFVFAKIDGDYKARELSPALELLIKANVINTVTYTSGQGLPLAAQSNSKRFKVITLDIGLMQTLLGTTAENWILSPETTFINKGAIAEAFVGQELLGYSEPRKPHQLYYWENTQRGSIAEIDYLAIDDNQNIIPIEVKAGKSGKLKSLWQFLEDHTQSPYGIQYSMENYSCTDELLNYPLYAVAGKFWHESDSH